MIATKQSPMRTANVPRLCAFKNSKLMMRQNQKTQAQKGPSACHTEPVHARIYNVSGDYMIREYYLLFLQSMVAPSMRTRTRTTSTYHVSREVSYVYTLTMVGEAERGSIMNIAIACPSGEKYPSRSNPWLYAWQVM